MLHASCTFSRVARCYLVWLLCSWMYTPLACIRCFQHSLSSKLLLLLLLGLQGNDNVLQKAAAPIATLSSHADPWPHYIMSSACK